VSGPVGVARVCVLDLIGRCVQVASTTWQGLPCCEACAERCAELDERYPIGQPVEEWTH
jgi:hypothetical protein